MKVNTIKWRIFKYNLFAIVILITVTSMVFNIAIRMYIENDITSQLNKIASRTEDTALRQGPDFFPDTKKNPPPHEESGDNELFRYYFMLDRSLREPLSVLSADFMLLDSNKNIITPSPEIAYSASDDLVNTIKNEIGKSDNPDNETHLNFNISGTEYTAVIKPVSQKNTFGLGWVVIYSSLQKVNQLQLEINLILFSILIFSALIIVIFSSLAAKKISAPFSSLNEHIRAIAERNFDAKIHMPVDDELKELVNNINVMSEKLETYDKAQKTFLQNASHEFRTPIMSIQSYAEGIQYDVVDSKTAANIIVDESKRLTHLVEDLLYLSRLDAIEESYSFEKLNYNDFISGCVERMNGIAMKNNKKIIVNNLCENIEIDGDEEKLSRAVTNVMGNCIRYADSIVVVSSKLTDENKVELTVSDDGPGFDENELSNIFERFYKGKKGNFGLGLSITKNVIEKHNGKITAENSKLGAVFKIKLPLSQKNDTNS